MMSFYIKESPATTTTATSTTTGCGETELDFDLLFSLDNFEEKGMFFIDEEQQQPQQEKKGMEDWSSFPMVPAISLHEIIELDAFDEVSLLTSSEDDTPCMVAPVPAVKPEVTKTSAKRKRNFHESHDEVASQCSSTMTNNKRQKSLHCNSSSSSSPSTAVEYINQFIKALNFGEFDEMQKSLQSLCSQKVKVTKHFYPTIEELRTQEEYNRTHPNDKQEEFISTMQFQTLPDFLHYLNLIGMMIPDGAFSIDNVRPCFENVNTSVYMASFTYSGTLLCGNMNLLSNKMSLLEYNEDMMLRVINHSCATKSIRNNYKTEGSVALYVNKEGMVNEIEFFETRCVFV